MVHRSISFLVFKSIFHRSFYMSVSKATNQVNQTEDYQTKMHKNMEKSLFHVVQL